MSSRTENDDPWLRHGLRTADCGPWSVLPAACEWLPADMTPGEAPGMTGRPGQEPRPPRESDGWQILSYMLGGMILYGGIGWLVSRWTGITVLFPIGMILGIGLSVAMIIFRFTRS
jgi:ATP synthase protein I